jgi:hypothetical protein
MVPKYEFGGTALAASVIAVQCSAVQQYQNLENYE